MSLSNICIGYGYSDGRARSIATKKKGIRYCTRAFRIHFLQTFLQKHSFSVTWKSKQEQRWMRLHNNRREVAYGKMLTNIFPRPILTITINRLMSWSNSPNLLSLSPSKWKALLSRFLLDREDVLSETVTDETS